MKLNPEYVKVASKMIDESPYLKLLGTTTELLDAGHYRCRMELDRKQILLFDGCNYRSLLFSNPLFRGLFHF